VGDPFAERSRRLIEVQIKIRLMQVRNSRIAGVPPASIHWRKILKEAVGTTAIQVLPPELTGKLSFGLFNFSDYSVVKKIFLKIAANLDKMVLRLF
jgi:hypothetical protein